MVVSLFLGKFLGIYLIIMSLFILVRYQRYAGMVKVMADSQPTLYLSAVISIIFGLLIVLVHPLWIPDWRVIVTVIGWISLVKGAFILYFVDMPQRFVDKWLSHRNYSIITGVIYLALGGYLLYSVQHMLKMLQAMQNMPV